MSEEFKKYANKMGHDSEGEIWPDLWMHAFYLVAFLDRKGMTVTSKKIEDAMYNIDRDARKKAEADLIEKEMNAH